MKNLVKLNYIFEKIRILYNFIKITGKIDNYFDKKKSFQLLKTLLIMIKAHLLFPRIVLLVKNQILIGSLFLSIISTLNAQNYCDCCGTKNISASRFENQPWYGHNSYLSDFLDSMDVDLFSDDTSTIFRIPVKFRVYIYKYEEDSLYYNSIKQLISDLNYYNLINKTGFSYYLHPDIKFFHKRNKIRIGYYAENFFLTFFRKTPGCINVCVVNRIYKKRLGKFRLSLRGTYNYFTGGITISLKGSNTTLAHEIGHFFGLLHPHRNWNKGKCKQEAVNRNRMYKGCLKKGLICEKSGDGLCDTPAEPNLSGLANENCEYTGKLTDNWGDLYQPKTSNIMSYPATISCRSVFTAGQIAVMLHTAKKKAPVEWYAVNPNTGKTNNAFLFDDFEPDNFMSMASGCKLNSSQNHTFHKTFQGERNPRPDNDIDWVKFEITSTKPRNIEITTSKGNFKKANTEIFLFAENGKQLASDYNGNTNGFSKIKVENLEKGWYYIKIIKHNTVQNPDVADYVINIIETD